MDFFFLNIHQVVLVIDEETLLASFQTTKTCAHTQIVTFLLSYLGFVWWRGAAALVTL